ncbi:MAG TPA: phosphate acyltransferase PlsX [Opitutaceae bacterium]|nr:phosphate acyltransferase PlsX [Opitutaceae bacterium]
MSDPSPATGSIAVDAMGGDLGPAEVVAALRLAFDAFPELRPVILVGDEAQLRPLLAEAGLAGHPKLTIQHASEVVQMEDDVMTAIRRKKDASMLRALDLVKEGVASAVVSTGNTKILVAAGTLKLRTLDGVERPALAPVIPCDNGHLILIDGGANPDATARHLVHNAILGTHYCRVELGIKQPRVGLLTIGTEEGKGNALINQTHEALKSLGKLVHYVGPIEGFQVFLHDVDVVVCDGFTGNICLKTWESLVKFVGRELKSLFKANPIRMLAALLGKGALHGLKQRIQPERYGGAPLLGLRGCVIKAHGSANRHALMNAIHDASEFLRTDLVHHIEADIAAANTVLDKPAA